MIRTNVSSSQKSVAATQILQKAGGSGAGGTGIVRQEPFQSLASGVAGGRVRARFDGSREQFFVGNGTKVSEVLSALPMVMADPAYASAMTVASPTTTISVQLRYPSSAPNEPAFYNTANSPTALTTVLNNNPHTPFLARLGMSFTMLDTDAAATAEQTSLNPFDWQSQTVAVALLRKLDKAIAQGTGAEAVPAFAGLATLCSAGVLNRTAATSTDIERDVRNVMAQIVPNGSGPGEGIDCLIGGPKVMRKLMSTASGQRGASGWRHDPRIGRPVYHYMGLPYYRVETDESSTGRVYGANLGITGVSLVYAVGTPQTYGLTVDIFTSPGNLQKQAVVHGAYALVIWEDQAIYEITGIDLSSL